jgi:non-heme chloroperoxidase
LLQAKLIKNSTLKVYKGASHGMCTINKQGVNEDLLAFVKSYGILSEAAAPALFT